MDLLGLVQHRNGAIIAVLGTRIHSLSASEQNLRLEQMLIPCLDRVT